MVGYFGGTFDPIHLGHLHLAQAALKEFDFEKLLFVPTGHNPLKPPSSAGASAEDRYQMVERAIKELAEDRFQCLDWEIKTHGPNYTYDTILKLRESQESELAIILGSDTFEELPKWQNPKELAALVHFVLVQRKTNEPVHVESVLTDIGYSDVRLKGRRYEFCEGKRWVIEFPFQPLPFAATTLRNQIRRLWDSGNTDSIPHGIQESVWTFIKEKRIYAVS